MAAASGTDFAVKCRSCSRLHLHEDEELRQWLLQIRG